MHWFLCLVLPMVPLNDTVGCLRRSGYRHRYGRDVEIGVLVAQDNKKTLLDKVRIVDAQGVTMKENCHFEFLLLCYPLLGT